MNFDSDAQALAVIALSVTTLVAVVKFFFNSTNKDKKQIKDMYEDMYEASKHDREKADHLLDRLLILSESNIKVVSNFGDNVKTLIAGIGELSKRIERFENGIQILSDDIKSLNEKNDEIHECLKDCKEKKVCVEAIENLQKLLKD